MRRLIRRLARTSPAEVWFRSAERAYVARDALRVVSGRDRWQRSRLRSILRPGSAELAAARDALAAGDWRRADEALRSHFISRPRRFVIGPGDRQRVASAIRGRYPSSEEDAARRADELLQGRYDLLGYRGLSFQSAGSEIDWHVDPVHGRRAPVRFWTRVPYLDPQSGDHKIIWELNRHQHWLALGRAAWLTGDSRYATGFAAQLDSWLRANPPLTGINWSSMLELAFRTISWVWALHLFAEFDSDLESPSFVDLLLGLDRQLDHVAQHLSSYFSPNTHLLGEGLALYVAGRVLPELTSSRRWSDAGRGILMREARAQVHSDGGHAELSTHYHRYALDFYLLALAVARRTNDRAAGPFAEVASRLATFCRAMADDEGRLPTIGDDDGGMLFPICGRPSTGAGSSLALAAVLLNRPELAIGEPPEEAVWMLGGDPPSTDRHREPVAHTSVLFPETGYAILRSDEAHAIVDVGPHGFLNGGHAHADALSLVLSIDGRPLLVDPGTSTYTMSRERRDRFRSTPMHNTVVIDGRAQSIPDGPFNWATRAQSRVDLWRSGPEVGYVEASHDGYLPVVHRRAVFRGPECVWLVADHILGTGRHQAAGHWHLSPEWLPDSPDAATATHRDGTRAAIASTASTLHRFYGDDEDGLGWCAPVYGQLLPATTLRFSQTGDAPFSSITAIASGPSAAGLATRAISIASDSADGWHRSGALVAWNGSRAVVLFATPAMPDPHPTPRRSLQHLTVPDGELRTDARAAILQFSRDHGLRRLMAVDCTIVQWTGPGSFQLGPLSREQDLHLDFSALRRLSRDQAARPVG